MPSLLNTDSRENVKLHFLRELLGVINGLKEIRDFFDKYLPVEWSSLKCEAVLVDFEVLLFIFL